MKEPRFCTSCKHFIKPDCHHPNNIRQSMVTGEHKPEQSPNYLRSRHSISYVACEPEGRWWEPEPPAADYAEIMVKRDQLARNEGKPEHDIGPDGQRLRAGS